MTGDMEWREGVSGGKRSRQGGREEGREGAREKEEGCREVG